MYTEGSLFSPNNIDTGTKTMLSKVEFQAGQKVLDLGCGYGAVGIYAAHFSGAENITMVDINPSAVELARKNALCNGMGDIKIFQSNGFENISKHEFDLILSNPPYHADFKVPKEFIENGFRYLKDGGRMVMVTKRKKWYQNKLKSVFGGAAVIEENGYYIFISQKRIIHRTGIKDRKKLSKKLQHKYSR